MRTRTLGKTGHDVSEIGFGAWQIGADWGNVSEDEAIATLHAAVDAGVTFFDTADIYGDGRSERLIGRLLRERDEELVVATKFLRREPLDGERLDVGETFAGLDFETGLDAVEALRPLVPDGATLAQLALRWILSFDAV